MRAILYGGTGMIGQAVLLELLRRPEVTQVVSIGRSPAPQQDSRLTHVVRADLLALDDLEDTFTGIDALFFCLGATSAGMSEADYRRITVDIPLAAGRALLAHSPGATYCFVSGQGTDATGKSRVTWARVKGEAENALQALGLRTYCFRPGYIQPMDGIESRTPSYRRMYAFTRPLYPLIKGLTRFVTSTRQLGRAMVEVGRRGYERPILESADINSI